MRHKHAWKRQQWLANRVDGRKRRLSSFVRLPDSDLGPFREMCVDVIIFILFLTASTCNWARESSLDDNANHLKLAKKKLDIYIL